MTTTQSNQGRESVRDRRKGHRRQGREMALQMLFQWDLAGSPLPQILREFDTHLYAAETGGAAPKRPATTVGSHDGEPKQDQVALSFARRLVEGVVQRVAEIDELIAEHAENWRIERMSTVDRNVLRLAVYELSTEADVPKVVVIDEAIEIAKRFGSEQSGAFVNGLLDALLHRESFPGILK